MRDRLRKQIASILLAGAILFAVSSRANAQTAGFGALTGTLTDSSGAVVPSATIVVKNEETGEERSSTTNGDGLYFAAFLQPGSYDLTVNKSGFATVVRQG